jgi:hypothetical protein
VETGAANGPVQSGNHAGIWVAMRVALGFFEGGPWIEPKPPAGGCLSSQKRFRILAILPRSPLLRNELSLSNCEDC